MTTIGMHYDVVPGKEEEFEQGFLKVLEYIKTLPGHVESHMYEAERKGEGLFFMRTQAAIKAATVSPEQIFGEWTLFREFEKPLCKLTLSNASAGGDSYKVVVKPGCDAAVAGVGLTTWRLDADGLLLSGNGGRSRFSESDATSWERIPASTDPMVLMRQ